MLKNVLLILLICSATVSAQSKTENVSKLPADIAALQGKDSDKILENPVIKIRLKKLLGDKDYAAFMENFETLNPIQKIGNLLFTSGCLLHACTHLESAIAIDLKNNTIHAAIFNEVEKAKYFNERKSKTPRPIIEWANRLQHLRKVGRKVE